MAAHWRLQTKNQRLLFLRPVIDRREFGWQQLRRVLPRFQALDGMFEGGVGQGAGEAGVLA